MKSHDSIKNISGSKNSGFLYFHIILLVKYILYRNIYYSKSQLLIKCLYFSLFWKTGEFNIAKKRIKANKYDKTLFKSRTKIKNIIPPKIK